MCSCMHLYKYIHLYIYIYLYTFYFSSPIQQLVQAIIFQWGICGADWPVRTTLSLEDSSGHLISKEDFTLYPKYQETAVFAFELLPSPWSEKGKGEDKSQYISIFVACYLTPSFWACVLLDIHFWCI